MSRIRTIKPDFSQSETIGRLSRDARLLFILLWTLVDDSGKTRAASRRLASALYPYDEDAPRRIEGWLRELERERCIQRYVVEGDSYLLICNWLKHQRIDRPTPSRLPDPREDSRGLAENSRGLAADMEVEVEEEVEEEREEETEKISVPSEPHSNATSASERPAGKREAIGRVFDHWRTTFHHPSAKLDDKRRRLIGTALETYSEDELCEAIAGYRNSPHHMGQNDRATVYDSIELFLRDAKHIDAGLAFARSPPRADLSSLTRGNLERTAGWLPPELRNAN